MAKCQQVGLGLLKSKFPLDVDLILHLLDMALIQAPEQIITSCSSECCPQDSCRIFPTHSFSGKKKHDKNFVLYT